VALKWAIMSNHSLKVIISAKELSLHHESSWYGRDIWAKRSVCSKVGAWFNHWVQLLISCGTLHMLPLCYFC